MTQILTSKELAAWLDKLITDRTVVAPRRIGEITQFLPVESVAEIALDYGNTTLSPKEWLFPKTDVLFSVERKDGDPKLIPAAIERDTVIFGIRPCDARGAAILDSPFLSEPADSLWAQRRDRTFLVGLSCTKVMPQCFCTSMGAGPDDPSNVDILLTETLEGYAVQVVTEKGKKLLEGVTLLESDVTLPAPPQPDAVPTDGIVEAVRKSFNDPYWSRVADRCIHCNICSYVCPTCYCFDIRDYSKGATVDRIRTWESCQSKGFSRIAGGHDPRADKGVRLRQRFAHKLLYMPPDFGKVGCTGCGRCVALCPVNIDIREIIADVQKLGAKVVK